ncbi:MAG: maleylpyruvate isomerase N-terminal domain-containing protein [Actinomycetota bacterium]|nr:maleylpyruvate isomerase N-terminal domain-containing protein [Actinomycetota bacterium]
MIDQHDNAFLHAAQIAAELVRRPAVAEQWNDPSALARMSVGALACHLGRQIVRANELLPRPTSLPLLPSARDHYQRAAWVTVKELDDPANDRSNDDAEAAEGVAALEERTAAALVGVRAVFEKQAAQDPVGIPWQEWSLHRNDFLLTRMLEIVIHSDDLAVSVGLSTPEFPAAIFGPVLELMTTVATETHGQPALIRALARAERAPASIAAF